LRGGRNPIGWTVALCPAAPQPPLPPARGRPTKLEGWRKLPGKAERFINPSGTVVSRRQYENERAKRAGWKNWSDYQRTRKSESFNNRLKQAVANDAPITRRDVGVEGDFSRAYVDVRNACADNDVVELRDPNGALADFLVLIGYRDADDWWDVGDTPGVGN